ncbi:SET domain-containing protein [Phanerochaete sordida]|uniref:SET domain-containing protein n=1 Tax=Phanerochaete sordida TaxID=48140 RepID=A0A9P3GI03_9APHY|nr:SET domain-containing protein [Phanerochaete sordida]
MPYADDDSFSREAYTDEHQRFSWQPPGGTSLHDIWIAVEAARRLQEEYAVDFAAVDATGILPTNLLSTSDDWGAIVKSQNMDRPPFLAEKWGKDLSLIDVSPPAMDALSSRVQSGLSLFCGNMNCVSGYCSVHNGEKHLLDDDDRYLAYADYCIPTSAEPCGDACYLLANIMDTEQKNSKRKRNTMGSQDVENLKLLFKISPESTSCEISQLMQYRCYEVYSYRAEYHRATRAHKELSVERPVTYIQCVHQSASPKSTSGTAATQPSLSRHFEPCSHRGPCEPSAQECTCYRRNVHCERNCCCTLDCTRRFPGCECARLRQEANKQRSPDDSYEPEPDLCSDSDCPCAAAGRECDPELCDCLHDLYSEEAECRNVSLRRKRGKRVKAGTSFSGLGVFLEEPVGRGELVCEYVGELTYEATTETRDLLAQHRGRAYVYKLNDTFDVDASTVGNVARFINHAPSKRANCITKIMNVSGDHRIGIYSAKHLRSGTELTIDYGDEFFKSDAKASSSSSRTLTPAGFERSEGKSVQE